MENYYEILEVSKKASPEVIEKAYKVLAKKYHPDMHEEDQKKWAEEKFKKINEAYEILSDEEKRKEYDEILKHKDEDNYQELMQEIKKLKTELKKYQEQANTKTSYYNKEEQANTEQTKEQQNGYNYYNPYYTNNYEEEYTTTKEDWLKTKIKGIISIILTCLIFIIVAYILWKIPFTREWLQGIYNENEVIKMIADVFIK